MSAFAKLLNQYVNKKSLSDLDLVKIVGKYAKQNNIKLNCGNNNEINREMFHYWRTQLQQPKYKNCNIVHILVKVLELNAEDAKKLLEAARCEQIESFSTVENQQSILFNAPQEKVLFINKLLDKFSVAHPYPIILLSQQEFPLINDYFHLEIVQHYAPERHILVRLPDYADENSFYAELGKQFKFSINILNGTDFRNAFIRLIKQNETPYFCFISRFEHLSLQSRRTFAAILRSIYTEHKQLHLILFGGQKLEEFSRADNVHSLINDGIIFNWPEWNYEDIQLFHSSELNSEIDSKTAKYFLEITGAHLKLLNLCFIWHQQNSLEIEYFSYQLIQTAEIQDLFRPFMQTKNRLNLLKKLLSKCKVAETTILRNEFLKKLYWKNLLVQQKDGFHWRCETIQKVGKSLIDMESG